MDVSKCIHEARPEREQREMTRSLLYANRVVACPRNLQQGAGPSPGLPFMVGLPAFRGFPSFTAFPPSLLFIPCGPEWEASGEKVLPTPTGGTLVALVDVRRSKKVPPVGADNCVPAPFSTQSTGLPLNLDLVSVPDRRCVYNDERLDEKR